MLEERPIDVLFFRYQPALGGCCQLYQPAHQDPRDRPQRQGDVGQGQGAAAQRLPHLVLEGGGQ